MVLTMQITLSENNRAKLDAVSRESGRSADELASELANGAIERLPGDPRPGTAEPAGRRS